MLVYYIARNQEILYKIRTVVSEVSSFIIYFKKSVSALSIPSRLHFLRLSVPISLHFVRGNSRGGKCNIFFIKVSSLKVLRPIYIIHIYTMGVYRKSSRGVQFFPFRGSPNLLRSKVETPP